MISEAHVNDYQVSGAILIRGAFVEWVDVLNRGIEKNMQQPGPYVRDYQIENGGRFFGDFCNWQRIPEYRDFVFESPAAEIAGRLMGSRQVRFFHDHVLVKEPQTDLPTPWHHDQPYYCVDGKQNCSLWLALDPVPEETAVEFIAGSHNWGKWFRPERFDRTPLYEDDPLEPMPDIEAERDKYQILSWPVEPGDAIAFSYLTIHSARTNMSSSLRRRAFSSRWVGDDATFATRRGRTSPPFPDCTLKHGEPLRGVEFPLVHEFEGGDE